MERLTMREPFWLGEEFWTSATEPDELKGGKNENIKRH